MRLTDKVSKSYRAGEILIHCTDEFANRMYQKLLDLEDIEDELGIDLVTLFKALKNGIYAKEYTDNIDLYEVRGIEQNGLSIISKICSSADCDGIRYFKDYGKTWALTKEELEK